MGLLLEAVNLIQQRIDTENHRPWLEIIEEVKNEINLDELNECKDELGI